MQCKARTIFPFPPPANYKPTLREMKPPMMSAKENPFPFKSPFTAQSKIINKNKKKSRRRIPNNVELIPSETNELLLS